MSLLAFLTGISQGSASSIDAERQRAQQEQDQELAYRRANLEHMVKAAEEGRVNPDLVGRVFEEYMNAQQPLGSKPISKGRAGFMGKRDLGENSLLRDLATGAVSLFGRQPGQLNIDWAAAKPKTEVPGGSIPTGLPGMPAVPNVQHTSGTPLDQLVSKGYADAIPTGGGGLYKHPDTIAMEQERDALMRLLSQEQIRTSLDVEKQRQLYGPGGPLQYRYTGNRTYWRNVRDVQRPDGSIIRVGIDPTGVEREVPADEDVAGLTPLSALITGTDPSGTSTVVASKTGKGPRTTIPGMKPLPTSRLTGEGLEYTPRPGGGGTVAPATGYTYWEEEDNQDAILATNVIKAVNDALSAEANTVTGMTMSGEQLAARKNELVAELSQGKWKTMQDALKAQSIRKNRVLRGPGGETITPSDAQIDDMIVERYMVQNKITDREAALAFLRENNAFANPQLRAQASQLVLQKRGTVPLNPNAQQK